MWERRISKMKVKRVFKYGTGDVIPYGAVYLSTVKQTKILLNGSVYERWVDCWLVWHYFLVEVEENE